MSCINSILSRLSELYSFQWINRTINYKGMWHCLKHQRYYETKKSGQWQLTSGIQFTLKLHIVLTLHIVSTLRWFKNLFFTNNWSIHYHLYMMGVQGNGWTWKTKFNHMRKNHKQSCDFLWIKDETFLHLKKILY